ncbi:C25 family cysteine peptidase [Bacteroides nordii]|uniref:C25 family cysteine peptidase n=2 Tax=Bacteroides nordii TaxID=291645 RepID=UPI002A840C14|nr:C25 family cysteine peptidase [Bacteroides nordii]
MKKNICFLLAIIVVNTLYAQIEGVIKWEENKDFTFQEIDKYVSITSASGYVETIGAPQLPYCIKTFLVPINAQVSLQVKKVKKQLLKEGILLYPVQPPVSVGQEDLEWVDPDSIIYNSLNPFPGKYAEIISEKEDFGYHLVKVKFYPLEYIPKSRELYVCDITFSLNYSVTKAVISSYSVAKQSEYLYQLDQDYIRSVIDNKEMLKDIVPNIKELVRKESYVIKNTIPTYNISSTIGIQFPEYLIITNEALKDTFQILADWKTKKGIPTIIETVENIASAYPGSDLQEKIRNYLIYVRQNYGRLFVLLGGDTNIVPARIKKSREGGSNWVATDFYYSCVEGGNWNSNGNNIFFESTDYDNRNDVGWSFKLGRAPVENLVEAKAFIDKVIHYEKADMNIDYSYINNSMAADAFITKSENTLGNLSNSGRKEIANYYNGKGLNRWLIYDHYNCKSNTSVCNGRHTNDTYVDSSKKGEELNKTNFVAALQNGGNSGLNHFHLIYHMDHSSPGSMGTSSKDKNESISNWDVDNLDNGSYYSILMSGGCFPADITKDCIAEHFLNNPNKGAVAFLGNTDNGWSDEHGRFGFLLSELYQGDSNRYDLAALYQIVMDKFEGRQTEYVHTNCAFHLFGDPEMQVWTDIPNTLNVSITPESLQTGNNTITVVINGLPQNDVAKICIQKKDELYIVDQLTNGSHTINVPVQTLGVVNVTVTAHNFRPVERDIQVLQNGSEPAIAVEDLIYNDKGTGASIGNGDGQLDAGETIELTVKLRNTGNSALNGVTTSLVSTSNDIEIVNANATFGNIAGNAVVGSVTPFVFKINKDSGEHLRNNSSGINLNLQISVNGEIKTQSLKIDNIYAPEIEIGNQKITWTSNGNTIVEASETVKMNIDLMNIGRAEATGLKAVLISNNVQASCPSTQVTYPSIPFTETKTSTIAFQFQTSSSYTGTLNFTLQVSNKYGKIWNFPVNPLLRPAMIDISTVKSQADSTSINVYWSSMGKSISYNIYRSDNGENGTYRKLNKFPLTATYYLDENLAKLTRYHYKVATVLDNGNESEWSTAYQTWTSYPVISPFPRRITTGNYSSKSCPNIADVDNDGKQELFWVYEDRYGARIGYLVGFRPTGEELFDIDGNVTTVSGFAKTPVMLKGQAAFGDLSGNGEQNIVVSSWEDDHRDKNAVYCYSPFDKDRDHKPDLLWEKKIPYSMFQSPVIANLDGSSDGTMEVVIKSHQTSDIFILDHNGNELRRLNPNANIISGKDYNSSALAVADLDDDGQMEIIASYDSLGIYIWRQDGVAFTTNPFWRAGDANLGSAPVVCDLNGDGKKELVFSQHDVAVSHVYAISLEGDKTVAGWNGSQTIPYTDNGASLDHTLSVGDIDNDGHLEVVILGRGVVKAWKHTGDSIFSRSIDGLLPQIAYAANINTPILADVDGDAIPDIVFCCNNKFIYALHNDGSDILGFPIVSADENFLDTPCVADIDNDGRNEIIAGSEKDLYVWKTEGIPTAIEWGVKRGNPQNTGEYFPTVCKPMLINANETWDGESPCGNVVLQSGRLVIPNGKTMTLNNTSSVIVRTGATLEVDGGNILNARVVVQKGGTIVVKNNGVIKLRDNACLEIEEGAAMDLPYGAIDIP